MDELKWGMIGSLEKAQLFAADLSNTAEPHSLHTLYTHDTPDSAAPDFTVTQLYTSLQDLLESDVDAIYVASSYDMHYTHVRQCLLHQKPVLCEGPIAQDAEELRYLMQLSQTNNTFMMEGMWIRFLPGIKKMLSLISNDAIGNIVSIKASVNYKNAANNAQKVLSSGGGALVELGTYPAFLCVLFLGRPQFVQATSNKKRDGSGEEFFSAFLSYPDGEYGFIEASTMNRGNSFAVIEGTKGLIKIKTPWSYKPEGIEVDYFDGTTEMHKNEWEGRGLQFEADEVYKCLQEGAIESDLYCHHFTLDVMETMDDIREKLQ